MKPAIELLKELRSQQATARPVAHYLFAAGMRQIETGGSVQELTAAIAALLDACDLPQGYHDPEGMIGAATCLNILKPHLTRTCRITPQIRQLLVEHEQKKCQ